ncbi:hypothetical protein Efla_006107 [Eimeria flavescens]
MAEGHSDGDISSEGSTVSAVHRKLRPSDRLHLWGWRFKEGGHRLPQYAWKIPHLLDADDAEHDLPAQLHALSLNEGLPEHTDELAQNYVLTKQKVDGLIQEKELLQWHISNTKKELLLKRSETREVSQQLMSAKRKIAQCRQAKEMLQNEHRHLVSITARLDATSKDLQREREGVAREHQQWLERRKEVERQTAHERKLAGVERKRRGKQLKKLQLAINRDKRVHVKSDLLVSSSVECLRLPASPLVAGCTLLGREQGTHACQT